MGPTAGDLYERGVLQANRGRYALARRTLAGAAQKATAAGDVELEARIAGTSAYVLARLGDVDAGEKLCLDILARGGLSPSTVAQLHGQLGALSLERGRLDDAADWLGKSIRGLADSPVRQANMRLNRTLVDMQRGRLGPVMADLELAETAYRDAGLRDEVNLTIHNRGYALMLAGDLVAALQTMQSVREPLDGESELWAAINELDRAEVLREAGLVTEAERSLESVSQAFGRHRAPRERATAEYHLARSLLSHDPERAAVAASAAARRFAALGSTGWAVRAEALLLRARLAVGRIDRAGTPVRVPRRLPTPTVVAEVVGELRAQGFHSEAEALRLTDALARIRRDQTAPLPGVRIDRRTPLEAALLAYEVRAARAAAARQESDARRHAARGLDLLDRTQQAVGSLDLQVSAAMRGAGLITTGLSSALRSGRHDVIFDWAERARLLSHPIIPVRPPPDPGVAADLAELRILRSASPDGEWPAGPRAALLRDRARERQWSRTGAGEARTRASLAEVRESLAEDVLLSYVFDGVRLGVLVASRARVRFVALDWPGVRSALSGLRADLDVSATVTAGPMAAVVRAGLEARLSSLSALLVDPVVSMPRGDSRIVLTAPGVLAGVPWMMLPGLRSRVLTIAPSASRWVRDRSRGWHVPSSAGFAAGPRVARGEEEVTAAASAWSDPRLLRGERAVVAEVVDLASRVDVLHIAAHGRHTADNPLFSGLELADGTLFGYDIDLVPELPATVVLSACEVGRSSVLWGEEAIGMTRVWLHAGTRCVIAAPVIVADDVACELLGAMHEGLAAGEPPSAALAAASERTGIIAPFQAHGSGF
ncbi:CHAT domain-containing protein [Microbacterium sp. zg.B48]|uniref:CHAT domain-containing protein n=1 Tax=Microbacterium sp. zg.B48 TaxID=2969408 RepID=UPI00214CEE54|nr:CHAT domain-containing protein [Microbacterium sp. zg.B48]MCR2763169.1 CHAT domain-containing protein [Microbacterium sp. zg.B48]